MLFTILLVLHLATVAAGVTPEVRLPPWYLFETAVSEWNPQTRVIGLTIGVRSVGFPLRDLSLQVHWPKEFTPQGNASIRRSTLDRQGVWENRFTAVVPGKTFDGWLEIEAAAFPDPTSMRAHLLAVATYSATIRAILLEETRNLKQPLPIGRGQPLHLEADIGLFATPGLLCHPLWPSGSKRMFLWAPTGNVGSGIINEAYQHFRRTLQTPGGNPSSALQALGSFEKRWSANPSELEVATSDGTTTILPPGMLKEALNLDRQTLSALAAGSPEPPPAPEGKPNFLDGYAWANRGTFLATAGRDSEAAAAYDRALAVLPAWPLLRTWKGSLRRQK